MDFKYRGKKYSIPNMLEDITLGQRIEFYRQYGAELDELAKTISEMPEGQEREAEESLFMLRSAIETFSFYSGIPLEEVKESMAMEQVLNIYTANLAVLVQQEREITLLQSYNWKGEEWLIAAPELRPDSKMTFNEFITAKEIVRQMAQVGTGNWEPLPYLCAIYFRKKDEQYQEDFVLPESERLKLMYELPLNIALSVGFFLADTMSIYSQTSLSSSRQEAMTGQTSADTSTSGDG